MSLPPSRLTFFALLHLIGSGLACADVVPELDDREWLPGGETTNTLTLGGLAYSQPFENAERADEDAFFSGNAFFTSAWVQGVSSTSARDGLGPLFNARSCTACHSKDGRGRPPEPDENVTGYLVRLSTGELDDRGGPVPHPVYGGQLQNLSAGLVPAEGRVDITYAEETFTYPDGATKTLQRPSISLSFEGYGPAEGEVLTSPRVAPAVIGLALLESISETDLEILSDPDDDDGDGISGRTHQVWSAEQERMMTGRFGWKAEQPTVRDQNAGAFAGDMGLTSPVRPADDCTAEQDACAEAQSQPGVPEVTPHMFDRVATYTQMLAPPARTRWESAEILVGRRLFYEVGCAACHTPRHVTDGSHPISAARHQVIWPYSDMLLHDMGEDLSDGRPSYGAEGAEWRTPPLWGISVLEDVNGHMRLLHDGRADGIEEAILWHGGEAEAVRDAYAELDADDRALLINFVGSL